MFPTDEFRLVSEKRFGAVQTNMSCIEAMTCAMIICDLANQKVRSLQRSVVQVGDGNHFETIFTDVPDAKGADTDTLQWAEILDHPPRCNHT